MKSIGEIITIHAHQLCGMVRKNLHYLFRKQKFLDRRLYSFPGLMDLASASQETESPDNCLIKASEIICSQFKIRQLLILLREEVGESSHLIVRVAKNSPPVETINRNSQSSLIEFLENLHKPLLIEELSVSLPKEPTVVDIKTMGIKLLIPMFQQSKIFGLLMIGAKTNFLPFNREELDQLNRFAGLLVTVLENIKLKKLTAELEITNRDLKKKILDLHNLFDVSRQVCHGLNLDNILNSFLLAVMGQLRVNSVSLLVNEEGTDNFRIGFSKGLEKEKVDNILIHYSKGISEGSLFNNQPVIISQLPQEAKANHWKEIISFPEAKVFVPLRTKEGMLAILVLGSKIDDSAFGQSDLEILSVLTNELSSALGNAHLYRELVQKSEELQQAYEKLWENQQLLLLSNRLTALGELAGKIAHEINKPLTGILGFAQHMLSMKNNMNDREYLKLIEKECLRCQETVNRILDFARQPVSKISSVDVKNIIAECLFLTRYYPGFQNIRVLKEYDATVPPIFADADKLKQVFLNLIINAGQALPTGGDIKISVKIIPENILEIKIADNGKGIPPEQIEHIFEPFFTTKTELKGIGLGLFISQAIIREHQGSIKVDSKIDKGTTFAIRVPLNSTAMG